MPERQMPSGVYTVDTFGLDGRRVGWQFTAAPGDVILIASTEWCWRIA
jgi:hypothetical protein